MFRSKVYILPMVLVAMLWAGALAKNSGLAAQTGSMRLSSHDDEAGFSLLYPLGWSVIDPQSSDTQTDTLITQLRADLPDSGNQDIEVIFARRNPDGRINHFNVMLSPKPIPFTDRKLQELRTTMQPELPENSGMRFEDFSYERLSIGKRKYLLGSYRIRGTDPAFSREIRQYIVPGRNRSFVLTFSIVNDEFPGFQDEIEKIVGSLADTRSSWSGFSEGMRVIPVILIVLAVLWIFRTVVRSIKRKREEEIIYYKDAEATDGWHRPGDNEDNGYQKPQETPRPWSGQSAPPPPRETPPGAPKPPQRKNSSWPAIIFAIIIINIIRQCIANQ